MTAQIIELASPEELNTKEALRFLKLLDPAAASFTFQTFDDQKPPRLELARVIQSPAWEELKQRHAAGAGVFVTINETDGHGRSSKNIIRVRGIWQDDDNQFTGTFPLQPSVVVETSPGHFQRHWFVLGDWPADEQGRADHAAVMERMIQDCGSDKGAKDICRVLRVPGFLHRKGEPHLVRIIEDSGARYTRAQILAAFPPVVHEQKNITLPTEWHPRQDDDERIRDALRYINSDDRDLWRECGMAIKSHLGERGRPLWDEWSRQSHKFDQRDQDYTWRSFKKNGIGIGTLFHHAQQAGWQDVRRRAESPAIDIVRAAEKPETDLVLGDAALYGLAGDFVNAVLPHTEADPVALLTQFLTMFGNVVGPSPYYLVESDKHRANIFCVLVGSSAKGRKGTSAGRVTDAMTLADEEWARDRGVSGLSSGEGLIDAVRDEVRKWDAKEQCDVVIDPGARDERLLVTEPEFAGALSVMERHGNTLSPTIRNAWDGKRLQTLTRNSPLKATGSHISIVGHITKDELRARLSRTDMANGFANRHIFARVRRSKFLPHGGHLSEEAMGPIRERVKLAVEVARSVGRVTMSDAAARAWSAVYGDLSRERPGMLGAITARAEAQTIRLALIYSLLDAQLGRAEIAHHHLLAALALWEYCEQSCEWLFGDTLGDPVADDILAVLRQRNEGMTRTDISHYFGRNRSSDQIGAALVLLMKSGRVRMETKASGGRPVETWFATEGRS
jgi:Primase C terminal 2 (PriCT-2)/Protein of unknown function (DUF3987)/RepB DNA-primase N-terminal domain